MARASGMSRISFLKITNILCYVLLTGDYAIIVAQDLDKGVTRIRLPSGSKKTINSLNRAVIGLVSGGGRTDKPMLKAGEYDLLTCLK